jgi:polyphosphate kinase
MPGVILRAFVQAYGLDQHVLVPGGQYHSFHDFFAFPFRDRLDLLDEDLPPVSHPVLQNGRSIFDILQDGDQLIHFPYQQFAPVYEWLAEAANDSAVRSISMTLYRVARDSRVAAALVAACQQGKEVLVLVEAKARFDEASNLYWLDELRAQGATVLPVFDDLKVHAKLLAMEREEEGRLRPYAYFGTGNFNEQSAELYGDHGLLTADPRLAAEALAVFQFLQTREFPVFEHLLVAPNGMRPALMALLDEQIRRAQAGKPARVRLKMNSLEDPDMIAQLYRASQAGVSVDLIVRGICCLVPGVPGWSENIRAISIVDRFLEHARCWIFGPSGEEQVYLASADWMTRNLSKRVEVGFPILDPSHKATMLALWDLQWSDNQKARILDGAGLNRHVPEGDSPVRAQTAAYELFAGSAVAGEKV